MDTWPRTKPCQTGFVVTAGAHLLAGWALWTLAVAPPAPPLAKPLWVALLRAEPPRPEPEAPRPRLPAQPETGLPSRLATPQSLPPPELRPESWPEHPPMPSPAAAPAAPADPTPQAPALTTSAMAAASVAAIPAPRPAPPPPPKLLRADQVRYLAMPPAEMPLLSRRAGESGVVWLRVRIDVLGRPARIGVHRSSGFPRLDEQAVAAMAHARFAPQTEDGVAVEVEVIAPIEYAPD